MLVHNYVCGIVIECVVGVALGVGPVLCNVFVLSMVMCVVLFMMLVVVLFLVLSWFLSFLGGVRQNPVVTVSKGQVLFRVLTFMRECISMGVHSLR